MRLLRLYAPTVVLLLVAAAIAAVPGNAVIAFVATLALAYAAFMQAEESRQHRRGGRR